MKTRRQRSSAYSQASAWVAYLLLALAMLGPAVCVIWLVQKAVESENVIVQRIVAEANERLLRDAEARVVDHFRSLDLNSISEGGRFTWSGESLGSNTEETELARSILRAAREDLKAASAEEAETVGLGFISEPNTLGARLPGGRSVAAMVVVMVLDKLKEGSALTEPFRRLIETQVLDGMREMPIAQRRHLVRRYAPFSDSLELREWLRQEERVEQWVAEMTAAGAFPPSQPLGRAGSDVYIADLEKKRAVLLTYDETLYLMRQIPELPPDEFSFGYAVAGEAADEGIPAARQLADPFSFATLRLQGPAAYVGSAPGRGNPMLYVWIGSIVLGLSVISGSAIVLFLRRQTSSTRLKNDLVATVSHELKTPVSSIRLLVDTLLDTNKSKDVNHREYIELIGRENLRLGRLLDNFLSFSRMERNKSGFDMVPVSPLDVIASAEEAFRERFSGRQFQLEQELDEGVLDILGDREALATVLGNLLENAYKYGDKERHRIVLRCRGSEFGARFEVEDFGRGISRRDRKRIFERFFQVDHSEGGYWGSVGLGLSIVEFIVSKHEGQIDLDSEVGSGSVFKVTIPYA